ncbi:hypothetical protein OKJ48_44250 [Streptomyces kunmingensis]|uniref:PCRF domain-containing protein n=1 Tax=Streptomyces kunmingensis TaxID=68225 RepID=A0ABU6CS12_9ACTN|nr:hypothetical protein [Streptomyces kunmingensis]MEB3967200.1 hypothetical protein [Streptomyces kunmingensis]
MDEAPEDDLPAPPVRAEGALDSLLARYEARIEQHRRSAAADPERLDQLVAERQELLTDKDLLAELSDEQLLQVTAIYETRNDALDSSQPDAQ